MARAPVVDQELVEEAAKIATGQSVNAEKAEEHAENEGALAPPVDTRDQDEGQRRAAPEEGAPVAEQPAKPEGFPAKRSRSEVVKAAREKRASEEEEARGLSADTAPSEQEQPVVEPPAPAAQQPVAKRVLKVDRRDVELSQEEMDSAARIGIAFQNRLTELNQLIPQLRGLAQQQPLRQSGDGPESTASPQGQRTTAQTPPRVAAIDDAKAKDLIEKIRYGDDEQGVEALRELTQLNAPPPGQPALSPDQLLQQLDALQQQRQAMREVGDQFAQAHPEIAQDKGLATLLVQRMHDEALGELQRIGLRPDQLQPALSNPDIAFKWHRELRGQGYQLSTPEQVRDAAATHVEGRYVRRETPPAPTNGQRPAETPRREQVERAKEQMAQPRRAAVVNRTPAAPPPRKTPAEVAEDMRRARGFRSIS